MTHQQDKSSFLINDTSKIKLYNNSTALNQTDCGTKFALVTKVCDKIEN